MPKKQVEQEEREGGGLMSKSSRSSLSNVVGGNVEGRKEPPAVTGAITVVRILQPEPEPLLLPFWLGKRRGARHTSHRNTDAVRHLKRPCLELCSRSLVPSSIRAVALSLTRAAGHLEIGIFTHESRPCPPLRYEVKSGNLLAH